MGPIALLLKLDPVALRVSDRSISGNIGEG
jgi:hypothetical protein